MGPSWSDRKVYKHQVERREEEHGHDRAHVGFKQVTEGDPVQVQHLQLIQALNLKFPKPSKHHRAPAHPPKLLWSFRPMGGFAYIEQKYWLHVGCFVSFPPGPELKQKCNNETRRLAGVVCITSICLRSGASMYISKNNICI